MECVSLSILILFSTPLASSLVNAKSVSCFVLRSQEELTKWELTCQFHEEISESQKNFQVYHIKRNGPMALVMDGKWNDNEPRFFTALGYEKFYLVGDKVVIKLPDVHHGDIFSCGLSPVLLEGATTCHVPQKTETPIVTTEYPTSSDGVKSDYAGTIDEKTCKAIIGVLAVITCFSLAFAVTVIVKLVKRCSRGSHTILELEQKERNYSE